MPNSNRQNAGGSGIKTAATFGLGAIVGALAAGAMWYFNSEEDERCQAQRHQQQVYGSNHPVNQSHSSSTSSGSGADEKDGTLRKCEICFFPFAELKECGVQIVTTPCGHIYCRECISAALAVKSECPSCRNEVHPADLTRLFI